MLRFRLSLSPLCSGPIAKVCLNADADAVAGRTGDAARTSRVGRTEVDLLQGLVETAIARALHAER